jgi:hypothetical protein
MRYQYTVNSVTLSAPKLVLAASPLSGFDIANGPGSQKAGCQHHHRIAVASEAMKMAERKGAQFDSSIMVFMAMCPISAASTALDAEQRWIESSRGTLIQLKKRLGQQPEKEREGLPEAPICEIEGRLPSSDCY